MNLNDYDFTLEFVVRDYECDMDGVVNNANYLNYLEHTRNECMKTFGLNYSTTTKEKHHLYIARINMEYKQPLRSNDKFLVGLEIKRPSTASLDLRQDIFRLPDERLIMNAKVFVVGVINNSYKLPQALIDKIPATA